MKSFKKTKQWLLLFISAALLFISCDLFDFNFNTDLTGGRLPSGQFWAQDFSGSPSWYAVDAELLAEGAHCYIWAEKGSGVNSTTATAIAKEYDSVIYPKMIAAFDSNYSDESMNIIKLTDNLLTGGDGKLTILFLKIRDNFDPPVNNGYMAGYFWAVNFYSNTPSEYFRYSNECAMIYIDAKANTGQSPMSSASYETIAHELQHLMNFGHTLHSRSAPMDTWIDEGLSESSHWVYSGSYNDNRLKWFNDESTLISQGNNFFVWGNRENESVHAVLDDYATVYLFFQWLRLQSGSTGIYKNIITSNRTDHRAVVNAMSGYSDWDTLLRDWLAANYIDAPTGFYGYKGEPLLKDINVNTVSSPSGFIDLFPGEGVYSVADTTTSIPTTSSGSNIKYALLAKTPNTTGTVTTTGVINSSNTLLTFNTNTNTGGQRQPGTLASIGTGTTPNAGTVSGARSLTAPLSRPYAISAGDLLRRNGYAMESLP